jgi:hypothetical protein
MKGRLYKIENEWQVRYPKYDLTSASIQGTKFDEDYFETLSLHLDAYNVNGPMKDVVTSWEGKEVEFEIIEQFIPYDNFKPIHKFAKIIKHI